MVFCNILNRRVAQEHSNKEPFMLQGGVLCWCGDPLPLGLPNCKSVKRKRFLHSEILGAFKVVSVSCVCVCTCVCIDTQFACLSMYV